MTSLLPFILAFFSFFYEIAISCHFDMISFNVIHRLQVHVISTSGLTSLTFVIFSNFDESGKMGRKLKPRQSIRLEFE